MSGHSKWSTIKRKKGAADAKRGKVFTKLIKEITISARLGGSGDPDSNPRLRLAIDKAKANSMPKDNIEKAIKRGTGELAGNMIEEISYEGYGPCGVALIVDATTDNKNRTVADLRTLFAKRDGNLGDSGSVAWMFEKKGVIRVEGNSAQEDELFEKAINAGAEDLDKEGDAFVITTSFEDLHKVSASLKNQNVLIQESGFEMVPKTSVKIENEEDAKKILDLVEALEDNDDVQNVWANFDIDDALLLKLSEA